MHTPAFCPYCNHLKKALPGHNYCSNAGDNIESAKSNAFYLISNKMYSGQHVSRLSIRGVLDGYQYYKAGHNDLVVKKDNYLILNQGQSWTSEIVSEAPVEMIVVAFHSDFIKKANHVLVTPTEQLLEDPFFSRDREINYFENTYPNDEQIKQLFLQLKTNITTGNKEELFYEQIYFDLLKSIFHQHQRALMQVSLVPAKKPSIRKELFQRLSLAKDFINAHVDKKLDLNEISKTAALSPYHFLRLFKAVYKITPFQYLTNERMKLARYLLESSSKTVGEISEVVGFEDQSAFGRVFKKHFGHPPLQLRKN